MRFRTVKSDGSKIVFERLDPATGEFDIYSANAGGSGLSAVAHSGLDDGLPDWGPHSSMR